MGCHVWAPAACQAWAGTGKGISLPVFKCITVSHQTLAKSYRAIRRWHFLQCVTKNKGFPPSWPWGLPRVNYKHRDVNWKGKVYKVQGPYLHSHLESWQTDHPWSHLEKQALSLSHTESRCACVCMCVCVRQEVRKKTMQGRVMRVTGYNITRKGGKRGRHGKGEAVGWLNNN